ncbi:serine/threonine-protein kinase [Pontiellaceae bacterium B12227]|nr:serine/threonine-protein kinase [Pontiellaceae bacterium B12227]
MSDRNESQATGDYVPDKRLSQLYSEANDLDTHGLEELCPAYSELAATKSRYQDESLIGEGALKEVFRTYDLQFQRWIAMARLRAGRGPEFYDLFVREARLVASLSHPNIIKVYNIGVGKDGRPFFTMDLKSNTTLRDVVGRAARGELHQQLQIFCRVCDAMAYAHSQGVVHLDLKPDNIQVDDFGEVLVCDWGLGKLIEEAEFEQSGSESSPHIWGNMTLVGQIKGSLGYMAPEQVVSGEAKDQRTDIYALGCILHFILTGKPPFTGTREDVLEKTSQSKVISPRLNYPACYVPEGLDAVVMKATALESDARYASVSDLLQEIESYLAGFSTRAEKSGFFREAGLFVARNRVETSITVVSLFILGVIGAFSFQHINEQRERTAQLSEEMETLDTEYSSFVEETKVGQELLAGQLVMAAMNLRTLAIYEHPIRTIRQCERLMQAALQQDPDSAEAFDLQFGLRCLTLDYRAALNCPDSIHQLPHYVQSIHLAKAFSDFDFSDTKRPSVPQLVGFFQKARFIDKGRAHHLERVLAYDLAARTDKTGYASVIEAYLQYAHDDRDSISLAHAREDGGLTIQAEGDVVLAGQPGFNKCLLRFISFRSLQLEIKGRFELFDLNDLPVESVDLSRCRGVVLKKAVSLPRLQRLYVRKGQFEERELRAMIVSNESIEIVERTVD